MDRSWITKGVRRLSFEHLKGVDEFMRFASRCVAKDAQVLCPCCSCMNRCQQNLQNVEAHLPDEEWQRLAKLWFTPKHKETCLSNKRNRAKVQFQQKTGSRSYIAHIHAIKEERNGEELSVVDMFKATHYSKKDGFSELVQKAIAEMESRMLTLVREGEEPKSATAIVAEVLREERPASTFLINVGMESSSARSNIMRSEAVVAAQVNELQGQLHRSEQQGEAMREELAALKKKSEEAEADQAARDKEYALLLKKSEENDSRFLALMAMLEVKPRGN